MAKVRNHRFRARKPSNLPKVGVAKHKVGGAKLEVAGAATHQLYRKLRPWSHPVALLFFWYLGLWTRTGRRVVVVRRSLYRGNSGSSGKRSCRRTVTCQGRGGTYVDVVQLHVQKFVWSWPARPAIVCNADRREPCLNSTSKKNRHFIGQTLGNKT